MRCHSYGNWELQFRCDVVGELRYDHRRWCLYSARHPSGVRRGDGHRDLDGRCNQIGPDERHDNAGTYDYVRECLVHADNPAGSYCRDQPMLCHSEGNREL